MSGEALVKISTQLDKISLLDLQNNQYC